MGKKSKSTGLIMIIIAVLFFTADIFSIFQVADYYKHSQQATGVVTNIFQTSTSGPHGHNPSFSYSIEFTASNGNQYVAVTESRNFELGDEVMVTYDSRNPLISFASFWDIWIFVIICSLGSIIFLLIGYSKLKSAKPIESTISYQAKLTKTP